MLEQISELTVCKRAARPAAMALGQRVAGDQGIRELEGKSATRMMFVRRAGKSSPISKLTMKVIDRR
jgi:hypothetical protein